MNVIVACFLFLLFHKYFSKFMNIGRQVVRKKESGMQKAQEIKTQGETCIFGSKMSIWTQRLLVNYERPPGPSGENLIRPESDGVQDDAEVEGGNG